MQTSLLAWSNKNFSHLPWRHGRNLYTTLVSEIMLQQTTVSTVLGHYTRFLERFPSIFELAQASEHDLMLAWKGLGYYRRAKNLLRAAQEIVQKYGGKIPLDYAELIQISGIGEYTANALLSIGAGHQAISVDANLERVLARYYGIDEFKGPKLQRKIYQLFEQGKILNKKTAWDFRNLNESLMDLGRTLCQVRKAQCELCPVRSGCHAFKRGQALSYPKEMAGKKSGSKPLELKLLRVVIKHQDKVLVYQKNSKEWLAGQFEIPTFIISTADCSLNQYPKVPDLKVKLSELPQYKTAITKYKITNYVLSLKKNEFEKMFGYARPLQYLSAKKGQANLSTSTYKALLV